MSVDIVRISRLLEEIAAEEVMPRFRTLSDRDITRKAGGEIVTTADYAVEERLAAALADLLPGARVVGEEATHREPALLELLDQPEPVWVIDPVDGTANFAQGKPAFAVMLALVRDRQTCAAWIHDPVGGRTATAEAGAGAWLGSQRLRAAAPGPLDAMRGTLHASSYASPEIARQVAARRERLQVVKSLRCAGAEYLRLALGEMHFSLFTRLMPWDHAPGVLILQEAGGFARLLDRRAYQPRRTQGPGLLMAPDEASWQALYQALFED